MGEPFRVIVAAESRDGQKLYVYRFARELLDGQDQVDPWSPATSGRWSSTVVWTEKPQRGGEWPGEFARGEIGPGRDELPGVVGDAPGRPPAMPIDRPGKPPREAHRQRCIAVCLECGDEIEPGTVMPFHSIADRDDWVRAHRDGTQHQVVPLPGWPRPPEAIAQARAALSAVEGGGA